MYKTLCVVALLLPTFALAQGSKSAPATTYSSPQIVAKGKFPNQTVAIPTTTILTPAKDGLYRLSVYVTMTTTGNPGSTWNYNLSWTDDAGPQSLPSFLFALDYLTGPFFQFANIGFGASLGGPVTVFEAKAGTPITYSVTQSGPADSSAYSLYYVLERLE
jgi:hypothetical protein